MPCAFFGVTLVTTFKPSYNEGHLHQLHLNQLANENVFYAFGSALEEMKENLNQDLWKLSEWCYENFKSLNPGKPHHMCLGKDAVSDLLRLIKHQTNTKQTLNFENHIKNLCCKTSLKPGALQTASNH